MDTNAVSPELLAQLNRALARELQVSVQYMLQHAIGAARKHMDETERRSAVRVKFIGSHAPYWVPGTTLKKVAITEMRHAEAIAEHLVHLGGQPTGQHDPIAIGKTARAMLEIDRDAESGAIELYQQIIETARNESSGATVDLFVKILADEEQHHRLFTNLLY